MARDQPAPQRIPLTGPPLEALPRWGRRVEFDGFLVELVPEGERVFNVRLADTFASINFEPAEGTSSLAGDRMRPYERRPYEFIVVPPLFPLKGESVRGPEVLAFVIRFDRMQETLARGLDVSLDTVRPRVVLGSPTPFTTDLAKKIRSQISIDASPHPYLESLSVALMVEMFRPIAERSSTRSRHTMEEGALTMLLKFIDANLDGDLTVHRLADLIGVSPDHLSRRFKQEFGESPQELRSPATRHPGPPAIERRRLLLGRDRLRDGILLPEPHDVRVQEGLRRHSRLVSSGRVSGSPASTSETCKSSF